MSNISYIALLIGGGGSRMITNNLTVNNKLKLINNSKLIDNSENKVLNGTAESVVNDENGSKLVRPSMLVPSKQYEKLKNINIILNKYYEKSKFINEIISSPIIHTDTYIGGICYGNGRFLAAGYKNKSLYSDDGLNWSSSNLPITHTWIPIYGNGKFMCYQSDSTSSNTYAYSVDGIAWIVDETSISGRWCDICYGNNKFVGIITGYYLVYSTDGKTWTKANVSNTYDHVCFANGLFVAYQTVKKKPYRAVSTDGINWHEYIIASDHEYLIGCLNDYLTFVMLPYSSSYTKIAIGYMNPSDYSFKYSEVDIGTSDMQGICYGNGKFVAVGWGTKAFMLTTTSITTKAWDTYILPDDFLNTDMDLICYGNGKFVISDGSRIFTFA